MERLTIADFMMCPLIFAPDCNSNVIRFALAVANEKNADTRSHKIRRSYLRRGLRISKVAHVKAVLCDFHDRRLSRQRLQVPLGLLAGVFSQPLKRPINGASGRWCLRIFETYFAHSPSSASNIDIISAPSLSFSGSMS